MRETESVCKFHSMINKNYLQHVGLVSSGQQRKVRWKDCMSEPLSSKQVNLHWFCNEDLFTNQENDVLKQILAFFSTKRLPTSSCSDFHPPTTEIAILVKIQLELKSNCAHFQEEQYKLEVQACNL
jgi:hypothetical protein